MIQKFALVARYGRGVQEEEKEQFEKKWQGYKDKDGRSSQ